MDAYLLLISSDEDLVTTVLEIASRTLPSLNVDILDTLPAALKAIRSGAYDLCLLDLDGSVASWQGLLCDITRQKQAPGLIVIHPDNVSPHDQHRYPEGVHLIARSRADARTLSCSIWAMLQQREPVAAIDLQLTEPRRDRRSLMETLLTVGALDATSSLLERNGVNGHANGVNGHTNGVNGHANGVNGHANGVNGHANGVNSRATIGYAARNHADIGDPIMLYRGGTEHRNRRRYSGKKGSQGSRGGEGNSTIPSDSALLEVILKTSRSLIVVLDSVGAIIRVNRALEDHIGYTAEELLGAPAWFLADDEERDMVLECFGALIGGRELDAVETHVTTKGGERKLISWSSSSIRDNNGNVTHVVGCGTDITEQRAVQQSLQQSEERFRVLIEQGQDDVTIIDADGIVIYESPSASHVTGYAPGELVGTSTFERIHPDDLDRVRSVFLEVMSESGAMRIATYRYLHKDGRVIHLESIGTNLLDDPIVRGVIINTRDVTDHIRIEQELAEAVADLRSSELKYQRLVEHAYDSIAVIAIDGTVLFESPTIERLLGYPREEAASMSAFDFTHPDDLPGLLPMFGEFAAKPGAVMTHVSRARHKDGTWRYLETTSTNLIDDPIIGGIVMNSRDVTERVLAEQEREELLALVNVERDRLNNIMRAIPGMIWESRNAPGSMEQETVFINDHVEKLYGYTVEEWTQTPNFWLRTIHPEDLSKMMEASRDFSSLDEIHAVHRAIKKDGTPIWADVRLIISRDEAGNPIGTVGFAFDVTDRIKAEQALKRSERRYRSLVTATAQIVWGTDASGIGRAESLQWGDPSELDPQSIPSGLVQDSWIESVHPDDLPQVISDWQESLIRCARYEGEYRLRTIDGTYRLVHARAVPVLDDDGRVLEWIGTCMDINDQREAEKAVRRSEEYFRLITQNSLDLLSILEVDGTVRYVSPSYERTLGWTNGERIGQNTFDVIHPDDAGTIAQMMEQILEAPGNTVKVELRLRHKDGSWKVFESFAKNLSNEPAVAGIVVSSRDITERKQAEIQLQEAHDRLEARVIERTEEIVKMMERLEEAYANQKRFVADASHDLRTPLTALRAELDLLLQRDEIEEGLRNALVRITSQAKRLDQLTNDLLVLATLDTSQTLNQVEHVRLDDLVIESICNLSTFAAEKNVSWNIQFDDAIEVTCDMTAMRRALFNVLENATKYSRPETVIDVTLSQTDELAIVQVTDHGVGILGEDLPRVFERFYRGDRTRSTHGTGLGLAIVKAVIEAHKGTVTMTSTPDVGTTVRIELPTPRL